MANGIRQTNTGVVQTSGGVVQTGVSSGIPSAITNRWKMDEGSGTSVSDSIGSDTGTLSGAGWVSDADATGGQKTTYAGSDDYMEAPADANEQEFSAMGWWEFDNTGTSDDIFGSTNASNEGWRLTHATSGDDLRLAYIGSSFNVVGSAGPVNTSDWFFVAVTGSGTAGTLYIYNTSGLVDSVNASVAGRNITSASLFVMTHGATVKHGAGDVDDVAVASGTEMSQSAIEDYWSETVGSR